MACSSDGDCGIGICSEKLCVCQTFFFGDKCDNSFRQNVPAHLFDVNSIVMVAAFGASLLYAIGALNVRRKASNLKTTTSYATMLVALCDLLRIMYFLIDPYFTRQLVGDIYLNILFRDLPIYLITTSIILITLYWAELCSKRSLFVPIVSLSKLRPISWTLNALLYFMFGLWLLLTALHYHPYYLSLAISVVLMVLIIGCTLVGNIYGRKVEKLLLMGPTGGTNGGGDTVDLTGGGGRGDQRMRRITTLVRRLSFVAMWSLFLIVAWLLLLSGSTKSGSAWHLLWELCARLNEVSMHAVIVWGVFPRNAASKI